MFRRKHAVTSLHLPADKFSQTVEIAGWESACLLHMDSSRSVTECATPCCIRSAQGAFYHIDLFELSSLSIMGAMENTFLRVTVGGVLLFMTRV
jgi:hypothetical protein